MASVQKQQARTGLDWQRIKDIFAGAVILKPENRSQFIYQQCSGDKKIVNEVESLLSSYDDAALFLESPAVYQVADEVVEDSLELEQGKFLKHYKIIRKIGEGGMGSVYLAQDKKLDRQVAIKILNCPFDKDKSNLRRFLREAKTASGLNHPHIMVVHEVGTFEDINYIVCEYIEGETLGLYVKKHNPLLPEIIDICIQINNAMAAAHQIGITHRDIKPDNIMVRSDKFIKILDFGLAKLTQKRKNEIDLDAQTQDILSTQKGLILGTVSYMSPEQARGKEIDSRTDIWSFGVILFQLLTGKLPFSGETMSDTLVGILKDEPPPLSKFTDNVPAGLEQIVRKCLQKNPNQRYQTADNLVNDLKEIRHQLLLSSSNESFRQFSDNSSINDAETDYNITAVTAARSGYFFNSFSNFISNKFNDVKTYSNTLLLILLAVTALIFISYFGFSYISPISTPSNKFQNMKFSSLTNDELATPLASISPDGHFVAYVVQKQGKQSLRIRQISGSGVSEITSPADNRFTNVTFSSDSNDIYYTIVKPDNLSAVYKISVLGGDSRLIIEDIKSELLSISPDSKYIALVKDQTTLIITDLKKGTYEVSSKASDGEIWETIAWHPDGKSVVGSLHSLESENSYLVNVSLKTGSKNKIQSPPLKNIYQLAWLADGSGLIFNGQDAQQQFLQIWYLSMLDGKFKRITNDLNNYIGVSLTADNKSLVTIKAEKAVNLWIAGNKYKKPGQKITLTKGENEGILGISQSTVGKIIYTVNTNKADIWSVNKDGSDIRQLTDDPYPNLSPKVTPDGRQIVFLSDRNGNRDIWKMNIDGTSPIQLTDTHELEAFPSLTPDGKWIIYQLVDASLRSTIWKLNIKGGDPIQLTKTDTSRPVVSPDNKFFSCFYGKGDKENPYKLAVYSIEGGKPLKIFDFPLLVRSRFFRWSVDGKAIIYIDKRSDADNLWSQPLDGQPPEQITFFDSADIINFDVSNDGKEFVLSRGEQFYDVIMISNFK